MRLSRLLLALLVAPIVLGNSPAPWWACDGKAPGDPCEPYHSGYTGCWQRQPHGFCVVQQNCTDSPDTTVNECMYCRQ